MTFWDFFHTHPVHSWILIVLVVTVIHMIVNDIVKVLTFKVKLDRLEEMAKDIETKIH